MNSNTARPYTNESGQARIKFSVTMVIILLRQFAVTPRPSQQIVQDLANRFNCHFGSVKNWFDDRRRRPLPSPPFDNPLNDYSQWTVRNPVITRNGVAVQQLSLPVNIAPAPAIPALPASVAPTNINLAQSPVLIALRPSKRKRVNGKELERRIADLFHEKKLLWHDVYKGFLIMSAEDHMQTQKAMDDDITELQVELGTTHFFLYADDDTPEFDVFCGFDVD